jgi:predicted ATP-dependent Lon-type protease
MNKDQLADKIIRVAMAHHEDISKADEDNAGQVADEILALVDKWKKCHLCDMEAVAIRRIVVDVDYDHDDDGDHLNGVWANVGLCQDHTEQFDNREGEFGGGEQ